MLRPDVSTFSAATGTKEDKVIAYWSGFASAVRDAYDRIRKRMEAS
jgi:hypothetical protein